MPFALTGWPRLLRLRLIIGAPVVGFLLGTCQGFFDSGFQV